MAAAGQFGPVWNVAGEQPAPGALLPRPAGGRPPPNDVMTRPSSFSSSLGAPVRLQRTPDGTRQFRASFPEGDRGVIDSSIQFGDGSTTPVRQQQQQQQPSGAAVATSPLDARGEAPPPYEGGDLWGSHSPLHRFGP